MNSQDTIETGQRNQAGEPVGDEQLAAFAEIMEELNGQCHARFGQQCRLFGVNEAEMRCLRLFCHERYLTSTGIAGKLGIAKSRVTLIIRGLVKKGLLERMLDPKDSRVHLLSLSAQGQQKCQDMRVHIRKMNNAILSQLSAEQRGEMMAMLSMLKGAMGAAASRMEAEGKS